MAPLYVVDTSSLRVFGNYFPETFPAFWERLNALVATGGISSVREVKHEIDALNVVPHITDWCATNSGIFLPASDAEMQVVASIFAIPHFQQLIGTRQVLRGGPAADAFLIARAQVIGGCVITEEELKPNAAKIPNVCERFGIPCTNVQGFLRIEGWRW